MPAVSIVIRAYNEASQLRAVMEHLRHQKFEGKAEIIVVDNGSTDDTANVAHNYGARVVYLPQSDFSYPKSLNMGVNAAQAPIVMCLVAHAYPESTTWIAAGLRHFADDRVAGVYSYTKPYRSAPIWDKLGWLIFWWGKLWGVRKVRAVRAGKGVFGATNIALRRSIWAKHPFDESYGAGGEDNEWAAWAISRDYVIVRDPAFTVRHSHNLKSLGQLLAQLRLWGKTGIRRQFNSDELTFRK